ncbi:MAG: hypothetical protein CME70_02025 [Halobacteriovorax sp.]|nr:hypothetical protein [Halobacteriovorax sp.]
MSFLSFFTVLYGVTVFFDPQGVISGKNKLTEKHNSESFKSNEKIVFITIDGLSEAIFSNMLQKNELPNINSLLAKNNKGVPKGIYTSIQSGIENKYGVQRIINYLPNDESYQISSMERSDWESYFSENDPITEDFSRVVNYLAFVTPRYDYKLDTYRSFNSLEEEVIGKGPGKFWQSYLVFKNRWSVEKYRKSLPRFSYIHLQSPGVIANRTGYTEEYRKSLEKIDLMLGGMMNVLNKFKLKDDLTIILTSSQTKKSQTLGMQRNKVNVPLLIHGASLDYQKASVVFNNPKLTNSQMIPTILEVFREEKVSTIDSINRAPASIKTDNEEALNIWY